MSTAVDAPAGGGGSPLSLEHEFRLEEHHFRFFQSLARQEAGIELADSKRELVYGRLAKRLRALGLDDFDRYLELVQPEGSPERVEFVNSITTNLTSFFREQHHFDHLGTDALPTLARARASTRRIRAWSAACSTGEEPYSIAITMERALGRDRWDWKVLATDIDRNSLARAADGVYPKDAVRDLMAPTDPYPWFRPVTADTARVHTDLRSHIYFRSLNLIGPWPMSGPLDVIFCRNVFIYFSKETQVELLGRFAELLAADGYLFIGHSETMPDEVEGFEMVGRTVYRRAGAA